MDKTRAAELITRAIAAEGPIAGTLSIDAFAQRLATGLDALGLLALVATDEGHSLNLVARLQQPAVEPTGAKSPSRDQLEGSTDVPPIVPWATTRNRIDPVT